MQPLLCMRYILFSVALCCLCTSCMTSVHGVSPFRTTDGSRGFYIRSTYGILTEKETAIVTLKRESDRHCTNGYQVVTEEEYPRWTVNRSPNGETDIIWEIVCK